MTRCANWLGVVTSDGVTEDVEKVDADPPNIRGLTTLRVVALKQGDLDALNGQALTGLDVAGQREERGAAAFGSQAFESPVSR